MSVFSLSPPFVFLKLVWKSDVTPNDIPRHCFLWETAFPPLPNDWSKWKKDLLFGPVFIWLSAKDFVKESVTPTETLSTRVSFISSVSSHVRESTSKHFAAIFFHFTFCRRFFWHRHCFWKATKSPPQWYVVGYFCWFSSKNSELSCCPEKTPKKFEFMVFSAVGNFHYQIGNFATLLPSSTASLAL